MQLELNVVMCFYFRPWVLPTSVLCYLCAMLSTLRNYLLLNHVHLNNQYYSHWYSNYHMISTTTQVSNAGKNQQLCFLPFSPPIVVCCPLFPFQSFQQRISAPCRTMYIAPVKKTSIFLLLRIGNTQACVRKKKKKKNSNRVRKKNNSEKIYTKFKLLFLVPYTFIL